MTENAHRTGMSLPVRILRAGSHSMTRALGTGTSWCRDGCAGSDRVSPSAEGSDVPPTVEEERWHASICDLHDDRQYSSGGGGGYCGGDRYEESASVKQRQREFMLRRQGKVAWVPRAPDESVECQMSRLRRNCTHCWHWISPEDDGFLRGGQWWCTGCYLGNFYGAPLEQPELF